MVSRYAHEFVAVAANDRRHTAVFRTEDIYRVTGMTESCQAFGSLQKLDAHWRTFWEQVEWPIVYPELNRRIALHAIFPGQTLVLAQIHASTSPHQRLRAEDGYGT